jgi:hypothetical protein
LEPLEPENVLARVARRMLERDDEDLALDQLPAPGRADDPQIAERPAPEPEALQEDAAERAEPLVPRTGTPLTELRERLERLRARLAALPISELAQLDDLDARAIDLTERRDIARRALERLPAPRPRRLVRGGDPHLLERTALSSTLGGLEVRLERTLTERDALARQLGDARASTDERDGLANAIGAARREHGRLLEELVDREVEASPRWLRDALGNRPDWPRGSRRWDRAARTLARYRIQYEIPNRRWRPTRTKTNQRRATPGLRARRGRPRSTRARSRPRSADRPARTRLSEATRDAPAPLVPRNPVVPTQSFAREGRACHLRPVPQAGNSGKQPPMWLSAALFPGRGDADRSAVAIEAPPGSSRPGRTTTALDDLLTRSVGRLPLAGALALAAAVYVGFGLVLPLGSGASQSLLVVLNVMDVVFAWTITLAWLLPRTEATHRRHLLEWTTDLRRLSSQEFEWIVDEVLRREGWNVAETGREAAADGNVDLRLRRGNRQMLAQCKRWSSTPVGVDEVRKLAGTLMRERLPGNAGMLVTLSHFTGPAQKKRRTSVSA